MKKESMRPSREIVVVLVMVLFGLLAVCSVGLGGSTQDAAAWLEAQQDSAGWFPWTPGGGATTNTQGPSGLGVLNAYLHTKTSAFLLSATESGDYMLDPMWVSLSVYGDGDPKFATHDPLFMESLSASTGDTQYAEFVQANFWDKLASGTYGASDNMDAAGYGAAVVNGRAGQGYVELSPWDLSATAIAAHLAGEYVIRDALMAAILDGLEATTATGGHDVIGLAGAVWASAITGVDLDPTTGVYSSLGSTADLAAALSAMTTTANDGAWLGSSTADPDDASNGEVQTTAFAMAALDAFDRATYLGQIARGVAFIRSLQQADGQFLGSVESNAEAISAIVYVAPPLVFVDGSFAGLVLGNDPTGDGVAYGYDAFSTIQDGVDEVWAVDADGVVQVSPGTYSERLTISKGVNMLSEPGSALHTTLNGDVTIGADNVAIGLPLQGFRVNDDITVEDLVDASSCSINWSDLYGSVTNNGTGTFNARYNYWGTQEFAVIDARTIGDVDIYPYLPKNADESYNDILALIGGGTVGNIDQAIEQLQFMVRQGQNVGEFIRYLAAAGAGVFQALPPQGRMALGRAAGGDGAIETTGGGTYTVGDIIIEDTVMLTDPVTGEPITDAAVTVSLMGEDGTLVFWGCAVYDETIGEYVYSIDTSGLAPGTYELIVQSSDGQSVAVTVDVQAA